MQHAAQVLFFGIPVLIVVTLPLWLWLYHVALAAYKTFFTDEQPARYNQQDPG